MISIITPCVLPLVPGYLSAVSAVEADRLGTPGAARRVALASIPFILGFTVVFVVLGIAAAAIGGVLPSDRQLELAGLILVVIGLTFIGLLPWPERLIAPGLLTGARARNSNILLGGAFAVCAAPCIGAVLASILAIASTSSVVKGAVLLAVYSAGLGLAFLLAAWDSRRRWARSAGSATTTWSSASSAASASSRSGSCSSSTVTGG